ncbi:hypothetical protein [Deinococcus sp. NW-56]|uniref:hypothetical protein n=1 Tax=Deinococcus sp. NW-56 TaxID=2080419 RepID=UPI000CF3BE72|nr:hypothetical protein [Deinococcus sp. NW-56]
MRFGRPRIQTPAGFGLIATGIALGWPFGRPSYVALEEWGGHTWPWWMWPLVCVLIGTLLISARRPRVSIPALALAALLYLVLGAGVVLSVGPAVAVGPVLALFVTCLRAAVDLRADVRAGS